MSENEADDEIGRHVVPERYVTESGREAIDLIRDSMTDAEFVAYCRGNAQKYEIREGKKDSPDAAKAAWYEQMANHVEVPAGADDPRTSRVGFVPYDRPEDDRTIRVLDHGFVRLVESWGGGDSGFDEAGIIEAARQSTQGSFRGWERDERLLRYLYEHKHSTPFEFAGMAIEVKAPVFVFRQWHRHRTQSYNEASARYRPLPADAYVPTMERLVEGSIATANKQAGSVKDAPVLDEQGARDWLASLEWHYGNAEDVYQDGLASGVPKELARLAHTMGRYSQMRASANLRNWLGFLTLRMDPHAQWEIRQFANAVGQLVAQEFPRTWELFDEGRA